MMSAPEPIRRARFARPLLQFALLVLFSLALFWGVELLRRQDPFLRAVANLPPELQQLELLLERPTLTLRDGARTRATLHFDALAIERQPHPLASKASPPGDFVRRAWQADRNRARRRTHL
jgi:hypothetical protein